jgi:hypothetical protein
VVLEHSMYLCISAGTSWIHNISAGDPVLASLRFAPISKQTLDHGNGSPLISLLPRSSGFMQSFLPIVL